MCVVCVCELVEGKRAELLVVQQKSVVSHMDESKRGGRLSILYGWRWEVKEKQNGKRRQTKQTDCCSLVECIHEPGEGVKVIATCWQLCTYGGGLKIRSRRRVEIAFYNIVAICTKFYSCLQNKKIVSLLFICIQMVRKVVFECQGFELID